jgi:DNA repair exonuclease SbcCD ATPase subunit
VEQTLGLDCSSFVAAVLLRQGNSERLLSAEDADRAGIMGRIVDLSAYERLHDEVNGRANRLEGDVKSLRGRVTQLEGDLDLKIGASVRRFEFNPEDYPVHEQRIDSGWKLVDTLEQAERSADVEITGQAGRLLGLTEARTILVGWTKRVATRADLLWKRTAYEAILQRGPEIEQQAARFEELSRILPPLCDWREAREIWRDAQGRFRQAVEAIETIEAGLDRLESERKTAQQTQEDSDECLRITITAAEQAKSTLELLQKRLRQLHDTEGKPKCIVCGQTLDPGHIEGEIGTLREHLEVAERELKEATKKHRAADKALAASKASVSRLQEQISTQGKEFSGKERERDRAEQHREHAEARAQRALQDLRKSAAELAKRTVAGEPFMPEPVIRRLLPSPEISLADSLQGEIHPSEQELQAMAAEKRALEGAGRELEALEAARTEAGQLDAGIRGYESQIQEDEAALSQTAQNAGLAALLAAKATAESALDDEIARFPQLAAIDDPRERERKGKQALESVRTAAEKPAAEAQQEIERCQKAKEESEKLRDDSRQHCRDLRSGLDDYDDTVGKHTETVKRAGAHRTLEKKLDRYNLQSDLRTTAEQVIVANADAILQRLSDGMLHLSLQPGGRTLDLRVADYEKGRREMLPAALSGSQKFRVSVALALGIGQYACGLHQGGVKSVIIDEGFGSLDKEGREKMIEELHNLGRMLERIIVVSHQEEFESAFPHRWHISVQDNTARAEMIA